MSELFTWNETAPKGSAVERIFNEKKEASEIKDIMSSMAPKSVESESNNRLAILRTWFEDAVQHRRKWSDQSSEDYQFYYGEQWPTNGNNPLNDGGRPNLTINKIKNIVNVVIGYQTQNRFEPDFLPRTAGDLKLADIRKHVTKYIFDQCDYPTIETQVFKDMCIGGIGWLYAGYCYDEHYPQGRIDIRRVSPFDVYYDPEARELDLSDCEYMIYATWQSKGKVARLFPEYADSIYLLNDDQDISEDTAGQAGRGSASVDPIWFISEKKKIRLVTCWYKTYETTEYVINPDDGEMIPLPEGMKGKIPKDNIARTDSQCVIRCATFIQNILLEDIPSPYENGLLPLIPLVGYYTAEGDTPAGIVRDIKDPQLEINKRRSQIMHIINTTAWNGWIAEVGAMSKEQKDNFRKYGSKPGWVAEVNQGSLTSGKLQEIKPKPLPAAIAQLEQAFETDLKSITGINEELLGSDVPKQSSGRAIELRQRSAITQIALLFDGLRDMKLRLMRCLWGRGSKRGLVQQFYKEPMMLRITADNEEPSFKKVNQPWAVGVDDGGQVIYQTLNDLEAGEFDIVITESPATPTKRYADFLAFMELMKTPLGQTIAEVAPDLFLEYSDLPNKKNIADRLRAALPHLRPGFMAPGPEQMNQRPPNAQGSQSNAPTPQQAEAQARGMAMAQGQGV